MQLPTVKQLRYLAALAEHKHFGRAATACFVSQSAFSIGTRVGWVGRVRGVHEARWRMATYSG